MKLRNLFVVAVAIVAIGCKSVGTPVESPTPTVADASTPIDASAAVEAGAPVIRGIFHLDAEPDERNLVIENDGTFFWEIYGCDYTGGACGVWTPAGSAVVLTPLPAAKTMTWSVTAGVSQVVEVVLTESGGVLTARARAADGTITIQKWLPGQVCTNCGGGRGPVGKLTACHRPLTKPCP